ncbi:MAG TPA: LiaF domain-containing protein [Bacteroidota bacterium]|nr:LiaF domain-containing protein [Bacteroidota bacterium]
MDMRILPIVHKAAPFIFSAAVAVQAVAGGLHKEIKRTSEKEVHIKLESSFGTVICSKGDPEKVMIFDLKTEEGRKPNVDIDYRINKDVGYLDISHESDGENSVSLNMNDDDEEKNDGNFQSGKWYMRFTDAVPLSIDASLGAGRGDFDMTGLDIKDFTMSAGASSTTLLFGEPNKSEIEDFEIKSGVSKFEGEKLCNANFRRMTFEGGVGSYHLNFDGELHREVEVRIKIGLGAVTILIPRDYGAKIHYQENWFSNFSIDHDFDEERKGVYVTSNYSSAEGRLNIYVESGLGSVKVKLEE